MTIKEIQKEIIDDQNTLDENLINSYLSRVWLFSESENDTLKFSADSDAILTKGIVAL